MILADKIINERKKNGWSQEELAEKLSVSRQSVSKWEGAQSIPDISKILQMAQIFDVSTDYLLKDEIEVIEDRNEIASIEDSVPPRRRVSMEEANAYIEVEKRVIPKIANGISLCIACPVVLIVLAGLSECGNIISENMAAGVGLIVLFAMIISAIMIFVKTDDKVKEYKFLDTDDIETEYGVTGLIKERKKGFEQRTSTVNIVGIALCMTCAIPLIIAALAGASDFVIVCMVAVLLCIVATAVNLFTRVNMLNAAYDKLLQEGDYSKKGKLRTKKLAPFMSLYWAVVTAIFLAYSFLTKDWGRSWIVWLIAGVVFPAYRKAVMIAGHVED